MQQGIFTDRFKHIQQELWQAMIAVDDDVEKVSQGQKLTNTDSTKDFTRQTGQIADGR